jgi:hypothetical protein
MAPLLFTIGVPEHQLSIIPKNYKTATLAKAFDWLHDIYMSNIYNDAEIIFKSVPPNTWKMYETIGIEDLTEQKLLAIKAKPLLRLWKTNRPRLFINRQTEFCENCGEKATFTYLDSIKTCSNCRCETYLNEQETDTE